MKLIAALGLLLMAPQPDYPVQVHIIQMTLGSKPRVRGTFGYNGSGELGVVNQGPHPVRYTFTFQNCMHPDFNRRQGRTNYPARWKRPDEELILFVPSVDGKGDECTLKLTPIEM